MIGNIRRHEKGILMAILAVGILIRLGWLAATQRVSTVGGEMYNIAATFAKTGQLANAFQPDSGLTAHVTPLPPILAGFIYRLLGAGSPAAELLLSMIAIGTVTASVYVMYRAFRYTGMNAEWCLAAAAFFMIIPLNIVLEVVEFRVWEGAQAALLLAAGLMILVRAETRDSLTQLELLAIILIEMLAVLTSPIVALALGLCTCYFFFRRRQWQRGISIGFCIGLAGVLAVTPWAIRNAEALGKPVIFRTNFGMVLASAYHDAAAEAVTGPERAAAFRERLYSVSPFPKREAYEAMVRHGGEVSYNAFLERQAADWITKNPQKAAFLAVRYATDLLYPPKFLWNIYGSQSKGTIFKLVLHWIVTTSSLAYIVFCVRRHHIAQYMLIILIPIIAMYACSQPILRYRYLIFLPMVFCGFRFWELLFQRIGERNRQKYALEPSVV